MFGAGRRFAQRPPHPAAGCRSPGIPSELQAGVDKLLADEPDHGEPNAGFSYLADVEHGRQLTLRSLVFRHWRLGVLAAALLVADRQRRQPGRPGADRSTASTTACTGPHTTTASCSSSAVLFLAAIVITAAAQRSQARVTGRLAARVMNDLRVKRLRPPPAPVARLLHRREGGRDHDPHDQRHREPAAAAAGRARPVRRSGPDDGRRSPSSCSRYNVEAGADHARCSSCPVLTAASLWFRARLRARLRPGPRRHRRRARPTCPRACTACASSPRTTASATTSSTTATSSATTATPTTTPPRSTRSTARHRVARLSRPGRAAARSAATWCCTTSSSIGALAAFFLYLNRFFAPIQLLVQQYNTYQQGQAAIVKLRDAARAPSRARREAPDADGAAADRGRDRLRPRHLRLRPGRRRCCTTST